MGKGKFMGEGAPLLLVDDEPAVVHVMELLLARANWAVTTVTDAEAAREAATASPPSVAVIDLGLKPAGGISLARELREADPDVALVFVSGAPPAPEDQASIDSLGAHFVGKPFSPEVFLATVAEAAMVVA